MGRRFLILLAFVLVLSCMALLAQDDPTTVEIDFAAVQYILATGIGGLGVLPIVELIKRVLKLANKWAVRAVSAVVGAGAVMIWQLASGGFEPVDFIIMTALVTLGANGIYLAPKPKTT